MYTLYIRNLSNVFKINEWHNMFRANNCVRIFMGCEINNGLYGLFKSGLRRVNIFTDLIYLNTRLKLNWTVVGRRLLSMIQVRRNVTSCRIILLCVSCRTHIEAICNNYDAVMQLGCALSSRTKYHSVSR